MTLNSPRFFSWVPFKSRTILSIICLSIQVEIAKFSSVLIKMHSPYTFDRDTGKANFLWLCSLTQFTDV